MKYRIIFTTIIALALYSFIGNAGNVTGLTTYASDTILNASDLNNDNTQIKSAVDDNNSNIGTNTTAIGVNTGNISSNKAEIGLNTLGIANNASNIGVNVGNIESNVIGI